MRNKILINRFIFNIPYFLFEDRLPPLLLPDDDFDLEPEEPDLERDGADLTEDLDDLPDDFGGE